MCVSCKNVISADIDFKYDKTLNHLALLLMPPRTFQLAKVTLQLESLILHTSVDQIQCYYNDLVELESLKLSKQNT